MNGPFVEERKCYASIIIQQASKGALDKLRTIYDNGDPVIFVDSNGKEFKISGKLGLRIQARVNLMVLEILANQKTEIR
jgi:hypothetical protein